MCTMNPDLTSGQRLMAESQHMGVEVKVAADKLDRLEAQNAKLRELVNDMWICISHCSEGGDCTGCMRDPDSVCIMGISEFSYRMQRLGIEVE